MLTIHAVPFGSNTLTAECGQSIDGVRHTGHFRPLRAFDGHQVCPTCDPTAPQPLRVVDGRRAHMLPTGRVTVAGATEDDTDEDVAYAAGYQPGRHHGFDVTRYDDGAAVVALHND